MLWTVITLMFLLWLLGYSTHFMGDLIHILLVFAVIATLVRIIQGRPV